MDGEIIFRLLWVSTLVIGTFIFIYYLSGQEWTKAMFFGLMRKIKIFFVVSQSFMRDVSRMLTVPKGTQIYEWYEKHLMYTGYSVKKFFGIKNMILLFTIIFMLLIKFTNVGMYTKEIYEKFDYIKDPLAEIKTYTAEQKRSIQEAKNQYFEITKDTLTPNIVSEFTKQDAIRAIQATIEYSDNENTTGIKSEVLANEIYEKLRAWKSIRQVNWGMTFMIILFLYFIPEIIIAFYNFFNQASARAEKRFLKRLIIMNGSIKPTDFMSVLAELIDKSKYYKKVLKEIEDSNKRIYEDKTRIYAKYIQETTDLETKLFFEKLDEANNYDFDQAITNIKNEFSLDKRAQDRKTKKMVEQIHVWGLIGFMLLIVMVVLYLLMPWLSAYDLGSLTV